MAERYLVEVRHYHGVWAIGFGGRHPLRDRLQPQALEWIMVSGLFAVPDVDPALRATGGAAWFSATERDLDPIPRPRHLFAGATLSEAIRFVDGWEGRVYVPIAHQRRARRISALWKRQYRLQCRLTREANEHATYWHRRAVAADRVVRAARALFLIKHPAANPLALDELRAALIAAGVLDAPPEPRTPIPTAVAVPVTTGSAVPIDAAAFGMTPKATYPPHDWGDGR